MTEQSSPTTFSWQTVSDGEGNPTGYVATRGDGVVFGHVTRVLGNDFRHHGWVAQLLLPTAPGQGSEVHQIVEAAKGDLERQFVRWCEHASMRPAHPMLHPLWRDLGDRGHGLYSGDRLCLRVFLNPEDGDWWQETYLPFLDAPPSPESETMAPRRYSLRQTVAETTLAGAKSNGECTVAGWLLRSHFMMRWDPNSLPIGRTS